MDANLRLFEVGFNCLSLNGNLYIEKLFNFNKSNYRRVKASPVTIYHNTRISIQHDLYMNIELE